MADIEETLPSVILFLKKATTKLSEKTLKLWGVLHLEAEINDEAVWKGVEAHFRTGMKIYAVEDFQQQILAALREQNQKLESKNQVLEAANEDLLDENQSLKAALAIMQKLAGP